MFFANMNKWTAIHDDLVSKMRDRAPIVDLPLDLDYNAFHTYSDGIESLLSHAVNFDDVKTFEGLLDRDADPTVAFPDPDSRGLTVLHLLSKRNLVSWMNLCIRKMAQEDVVKFVNKGSQKGGGWTPLMSAAENNRIDSAMWLLDHGADFNQYMYSGWTASHAAAKKGNYEILKLFLDRGADKNMTADHREYGRNLKVEDVTADINIMKLLNKYN